VSERDVHGGGTNTLKFRLPENPSKLLLARTISDQSITEQSDLVRPNILGSMDDEELVWTV